MIKMLNNFWLYLRRNSDNLNKKHDKAAKKIGLMGIGELSGIKYTRKWRWLVEVKDEQGNEVLSPQFVKVHSRPVLPDLEETEINFLSAKTWIPGKSAYDHVTVTYYGADSSMSESLYDLACRTPEKHTVYLKLYDGVGVLLETWTLENASLSTINWGDLDEASVGDLDLECTWIYSEVKYDSNCTA